MPGLTSAFASRAPPLARRGDPRTAETDHGYDQDVREHRSSPRNFFFGVAAATIAAAQPGLVRPVRAEPGKLPAIKPGTNTSLGPLKQIDAGLLNVGYAEAGPAGGPAVILLHGWPYDIHAFVDVTPMLASAAGYRVIIRICAAMARRGFCRARRLATASRRRSAPMSSP
jgi:hypothetical protein